MTQAARSPLHCIDPAARLYMHWPADSFDPGALGGYTPRYLLAVVQRLMGHAGDVLEDVDLYMSTPSLMRRFGALEPRAGRRNLLFFFGDELAEVDAFAGFRWVFRQYLRQRTPQQHPMPLPGLHSGKARDHLLDMASRPVSVAFSGNMNANRVALYMALKGWPWPDRSFLLNRVAARLLRERMPERMDACIPGASIAFTQGFGQGLGPEDYLALLESARLTPCPGGFVTQETIRHYEAACAGSVVVTVGSGSGNVLLDSAPFHRIRSWRHARAELAELAGDLPTLQTYQSRAYTWWREHCSEEAFARQVADIVRRG